MEEERRMESSIRKAVERAAPAGPAIDWERTDSRELEEAKVEEMTEGGLWWEEYRRRARSHA